MEICLSKSLGDFRDYAPLLDGTAAILGLASTIADKVGPHARVS